MVLQIITLAPSSSAQKLATFLPSAEVVTTVPTTGKAVLLTSYADGDVQRTAEILRVRSAGDILPLVQIDADFPFLSLLRQRAKQAWVSCPLIEWSSADDWQNLAMMIQRHFATVQNPSTAGDINQPQEAVLRARQVLEDVF